MPGKRDRKPDGRFQIGDLIMNRYKVLAELGQGGMGVVYKCFDETAGIEVALKALPPELSHNSLEMEDIRENFQLVAKLVHQNIAISKNLEKDDSNGNFYLIMECCEGEDLRRWIKRKRKEGKLTIGEIHPIIKQVADALDYAHKQKIIHRDIKPGNIMINSSGDIKVLDFGLAAQIHTSMSRVSMAYHGTSGTGPYMAPEQWRGRAQGPAADQYALAVMTYEMLSGHLPFENADAAVLREAVLKETPEEIPDLPQYAQKAIKCAMSKEPAERFAACSEFAAALSGKKVKGSSGQKRNKMGKWIAAMIILVLMGTGAGSYFLIRSSQAPAPAPVPAPAPAPAEVPVRSAPEKKSETKAEKEVRRLRAALISVMETIESKIYDRGQNFGRYLDALKNNFESAERARKNNDPDSALDFLKKASQAVEWLDKNAPLRRKFRQLQKELVQAVKQAEQVKSRELMPALFNEAQKQSEEALQKFETGDFESALKSLKSSLDNFRKAAVKSNEQALKNLLFELHGKVASKKLEIEAAGYDRGQEFGKYLDALKNNFESAKLAWDQNDLAAVRSFLNEADQAAAWINENAPLRQEFRTLHKDLDEARARAEQAQGKDLAIGIFKEAQKQADEAQKSYKAAKFKSAISSLRASISNFRKVSEKSGELVAQNLLRCAEQALKNREWAKVKEIAEKIRAFDNTKATGLILLSERQLKLEQLRKTLDAAIQAKRSGNWLLVRELANEALRIDSSCNEAQRLQQEAGINLIPTLIIDAYVNNQKVEPVTVRALKTTPDWKKGPWKLRKGAEYEFEVLYQSGEEEYSGRIAPFICTSDGPCRKRVFLKKADLRKTIALPSGVKLEMIKVEPGTFVMSKRDGDSDNDEVEHRKTLTQPFYIGKFEVTNEQWCAVLNVAFPPSITSKGAKNPVEFVTWHDAMLFCERMNQFAPPGWRFTLPTETQWEFAAKGGNRSRNYKYSGGNHLNDVGWFMSNSGRTTRQVGLKAPNELGLYDMSGNVYEWCLDDYFMNSSATQAEFSRPYRNNGGAVRVRRGGGWNETAFNCRSARRGNWMPGIPMGYIGFRLALVPVPAPRYANASR